MLIKNGEIDAKVYLLISRSSVLLALAAIFATVESKELEAQKIDENTTIEELLEDKNHTSGKLVKSKKRSLFD